MRENEAKKYIPGMTNHKIRRERERETGERERDGRDIYKAKKCQIIIIYLSKRHKITNNYNTFI